MAMSGKKGKKSKGKTLNLQDFLSENGAPPTSSVVTKSLSWANECEDDDYSPPKIHTYAIPTAPRSQRVLDDSTIPTSPPFSAHISNLPYDLNETDIQEYFEGVTNSVVLSVRLPREDGDSGRMRGFGYIEFGDRDGLIAAVSQPELTLRNRKIRIDVSTENDSKRGGNRRYDNFGASDNRDSNWRRGQGGQGGQGGQDSNDSSSRRSDVENGGNWRSGDRPKMESPPPSRRGYGRRNNDFDERNRRDDDRAPVSEERPRIKLTPRTLPLPELQIDERERERETPKPEVTKPRPKPVPSADIFGAAKPVDTAAKDREIEARLEKERERIQKEAELAEMEKAENQAKAEVEKDNETTPEEPEEISHENGNVEHQDNDDESSASADKAQADKLPAEVISWRRKPGDDQGEEQDEERRSHSPTRKRYSPDRRRRQHPDERRGPRDNNRKDNYNNRDKRDFNRDYQRSDRDRDRNYNRDKMDRSQNRNYNNRGAPPQQQRDEHDNKPKRAPQNPDEIENRMPKLKADVKPKIQMSNAYEIFNDEASD